jgi:exodeoxyribonuclease VII small subunit
MANDPKQFDFASSIHQLEEINTWFQNEDLDLDEGLEKLKRGKELIKKCRTRLQEVENEFIEIKKEFAQEVPHRTMTAAGQHEVEDIEPENTPF